MEGLFPGGRLCHDGQSIFIPDLDSLRTLLRAADRCVVVFIVVLGWPTGAMARLSLCWPPQSKLVCITRPVKKKKVNSALHCPPGRVCNTPCRTLQFPLYPRVQNMSDGPARYPRILRMLIILGSSTPKISPADHRYQHLSRQLLQSASHFACRAV